MSKKIDMSFLEQLTSREQKLVFELAKRTCSTRAMLAAGYSLSTSYKKQWLVCRRPRIQRALLQIQYKRYGSEFMTDEELNMIGKDPAKERAVEERKMEAEAKQSAKAYIARILGR